MATRIYGASDDLIEVDGDVNGEESRSSGTLTCSDGTVLKVKYGKPHDGGLWGITLMKMGPLFERIDQCYVEQERAPGVPGYVPGAYSDMAHFRDGLEWVKCGGKVVR